MCNFHVTIFVALNFGRHKSMFTFFEDVKFSAWVSPIVSDIYFVLSFYVSLPVTTDSAVQ